jgi:hypothetical protein
METSNQEDVDESTPLLQKCPEDDWVRPLGFWWMETGKSSLNWKHKIWTDKDNNSSMGKCIPLRV